MGATSTAPPSASPARAPATAPEVSGRRRPGSAVTLVPGVLVIAAVVVVAALSHPLPAAHAGPGFSSLVWTGPSTASNGVLRAAVAADVPNISVAPAAAASNVGLRVTPVGLQEIGSGGALIASLPLSSSGAQFRTWTTTNASTAAQLWMQYVAYHSPTRPNGNVVGATVEVAMAFTSAADAADGGNLTVSLSVQGWPWVHPTDSLLLFLNLSPVDPTATSLIGRATDEMDLQDAGGTVVFARAYWPSTVLAEDSAGDQFTVGTASVVRPTSAGAELVVGIPASNGGYRAIDAALVLAVPTTTIGPPAPVSPALVVLCVGWAGIVGAIVWIAVARAADRPSSLRWVGETDEDPGGSRSPR